MLKAVHIGNVLVKRAYVDEKKTDLDICVTLFQLNTLYMRKRITFKYILLEEKCTLRLHTNHTVKENAIKKIK